jgi:TonB family protein
VIPAIAVALAIVTAAAPASLDAVLAKPVTPGAIALLVEHAHDPRAVERLTTALASPDPAVRAAAARVATVTGATVMVPALEAAAAPESDAVAGAEIVRALLVLAGPRVDQAVLAHARRLQLVDFAAESLGRARGPAAIGHLAALREAGLSDRGRTALFRAATREGTEGFSQAAVEVLRARLGTDWDQLLDLAREARATIDDGLLVAAARSPEASMRAATWWHLAVTRPPGQALPPDLAEALRAAPEGAEGAEADARAAFAAEILRRVVEDRRGPSSPAASWAARLKDTRRARPGGLDAVRDRFASDELEALSLAVSGGHRTDLFVKTGTRIPVLKNVASGRMRLLRDLPPGLLSSTLEASGCRASPRALATAVVVYRPDGRPQAVELADRPRDAACLAAARAALALSVAGRDHPARAHRVLLAAWLGGQARACGDEGSAPGLRDEDPVPQPVGAEIREPRKVQNVPPFYPEDAKHTKLQGVVILEALIDASGCIAALEVLKGVAPSLDAAALIAVSQWRYTPTLLAGRPVPVIMTVTVNFRLS